jgi:hypothetical protein
MTSDVGRQLQPSNQNRNPTEFDQLIAAGLSGIRFWYINIQRSALNYWHRAFRLSTRDPGCGLSDLCIAIWMSRDYSNELDTLRPFPNRLDGDALLPR